jgi:chorismate mutase
MKHGNYYIVDQEVLPDVFDKVLEAKRLLNTKEVTNVTDATKTVGISRSTYYKYCNHIFKLSESQLGNNATLTMDLEHKSGVLSHILDIIAENNGNILTITQDTPVDGMAKVTLKFSITDLTIDFAELIEQLNASEGISNLNILTVE